MPSPITELIQDTLLIVGALFPIVNTPENVPIFLSLTSGFSAGNRAVLARKIAVNGFALLVVAVLIGTHILAFFGISLPVVQVGGGLVLTVAGWKLLNRADDGGRPPAPSSTLPEARYLTSRAFYPLTMPLTVGPGSISVAIALGANRAIGSEARWTLPVAAVLGCAVLAVTIYLLYRFAERLGRFIGESATSIIVRLSSFILVCIGVQIVWNGMRALLQTI